MTEDINRLAQLLPCPFCGSAPVTERTGFSGRAMYIYCINDNGCPRPKAIGETEEKATENWNTRFPQPHGPQDEEAAACCEWWQEQYLQQAARIEKLERIIAQVERTADRAAIVEECAKFAELCAENAGSDVGQKMALGIAANMRAVIKGNSVPVETTKCVATADGKCLRDYSSVSSAQRP